MPQVLHAGMMVSLSIVMPIMYDIASYIFIARDAGSVAGKTQVRKNYVTDLDKGRILPQRLQAQKDRAAAEA